MCRDPGARVVYPNPADNSIGPKIQRAMPPSSYALEGARPWFSSLFYYQLAYSFSGSVSKVEMAMLVVFQKWRWPLYTA